MKEPAELLRRAKVQAKLCEENGYPHFAPMNGVCWSCQKNIYETRDGSSLITSCSNCNRSYCD